MTRRPLLLLAGIAVIVAALISPLETESGRYFWVHMCQHMVFVLVAAPLISGSRMFTAPAFLRSGIVVWALHAIALWAWHMPVLYDAAMRSQPLHALEHASFVITAVLFWNLVFDKAVDRFKRAAVVFGTMLQSGALGAILVFASAPLYEWHLRNTPSGRWGTPEVLESQQLAGAIMWVPQGFVYLAIMVALVAQALNALDVAEQR